MTPPAVDVVVVGAGTIGACTAYELARAGLRVHVVDEGPRPASGCSRANAGLLAPSHCEPLTGAGNIRTGLRHMLRTDSSFHVRPSPELLPWLVRFGVASSESRVAAATRTLRDLGRRSLQRHAAYRDAGIGTSFERRGLIDVFASERSRAAGLDSLARTPLDLDYDILDEHEVHSAVPGLATAASGIRFRAEGHCDSAVLAESMLGAAQQLGTVVTFGTRVHDVVHRDGRARGVRTRSGDIAAEHVVIAGGHQSSRLLRPLGSRLPLAPAKGYVIDLEPGPGDPTQPVGLKDDMVVITPYPDRVRLAGTLELVGTDTRISPARTAAIRRAADLTLPALADRRTLTTWAGLRPCSADGLPFIGPIRSTKGVTVATGHGQQGVLLAPITGQLVTDLVTGTAEPSPDLDPARFRPLGRLRARMSQSG